jgi:hypothetical protein
MSPCAKKADHSVPLLLPPCPPHTNQYTGVLKNFGSGRFHACPDILQAHTSKPHIHQPSISPNAKRVGHGRPLLLHAPIHQSIYRGAKKFRQSPMLGLSMFSSCTYLEATPIHPNLHAAYAKKTVHSGPSLLPP